MRVCIIAEGSYPYVTGGVSTWIHTLIQNMPHINFKILSIMPRKETDLQPKYPIPDNLDEIKTLYLQDFKDLKSPFIIHEPKLTSKETRELKKIIMMDSRGDWSTIIRVFADKGKVNGPINFLKSRSFWNFLIDFYKETAPDEAFNTFFWTVRSMWLPLLHVIQFPLPEAEVYHSVSTGYAGILGLKGKLLHNKAFILTEHGIYAREREEEILKAPWVKGVYKKMWIKLFYLMSQGAYHYADKIISLFNRNRELQLSLGAGADKTIVIPNGVDVDSFNISKKQHSGYVIGAILRVVPIKDVKTLIRAFKFVKLKMEKVKLYIIGPYDEDRDYYYECVNLAKRLNLENDIVFTGKVDVRKYLKTIDVLVLTSISEGQPLVMLEGMAAATPIVATDVGGCRELIEGSFQDNSGPCGIVTPPVSPKATAQAIVKILEDERLKKKMGENGRRRVSKYYSQTGLIQSYKKLYERAGNCIWQE